MPFEPREVSDRSFVTGSLNFASAYLQAANHLIEAYKGGQLRLTYDAPMFALLAHSLELLLKGTVVNLGATQETATGFGHNIQGLYQELGSSSRGQSWKEEIERANRHRWKSLLRTARDEHEARMRAAFGPHIPAEELGILDNKTIGDNLPSLPHQVRWLSERHSKGGSKFRYLESGSDSYFEINAFGLNENVPLKSVQWACVDLSSTLREEIFPRNRRQPRHT